MENIIQVDLFLGKYLDKMKWMENLFYIFKAISEMLVIYFKIIPKFIYDLFFIQKSILESGIYRKQPFGLLSSISVAFGGPRSQTLSNERTLSG